jgi:type II secretory pathway component PulK
MRPVRPASVLIMVVFVIAVISAVVIGILELNTEEIQLMQNHVYAVQAGATAEAGLNDALAQLRLHSDWDAGFADKPFEGGVYTVTVDGSTIRATGTTSRGFAARWEAEVAVSLNGPPHSVTIDRLRISQ